ncbi:hypothetical protein N9006_00505 [bacterium]|nr:hypothetical protein [bacterium]
MCVACNSTFSFFWGGLLGVGNAQEAIPTGVFIFEDDTFLDPSEADLDSKLLILIHPEFGEIHLNDSGELLYTPWELNEEFLDEFCAVVEHGDQTLEVWVGLFNPAENFFSFAPGDPTKKGVKVPGTEYRVHVESNTEGLKHMHVYDKNGKQVGTEGVDGGTHDNKTLKDSKIPKRHHEIIRKTARAKVLKQLKAARTGGGLTGRITGHQTRLQRKLPVTGFLPLTVLQGVTGAAADAV